MVAGTPDFMALEQVGGKPVFASDLYSLGMTAICLLTGKSPKEMVNQLTGSISWREHAPSVDDKFAAILDRSIKYDFRDRYQTAQEMLSSLEGNTTLVGEDETTIVATQPASGSSSNETIVDQLPSSNLAARTLVDQGIKEIVADSKGSMGSFWVESPNAMIVWRRLYGELRGNEIPELCHILGEAQEWEVYWKAITLLSYSVIKPEGKPFQLQILTAISNHIAKGGYLQTAALALLQKLPIRREIWECLIESLQFAQRSREAYEIVKIIVRFTPPDKRDQTGAVILELFSLLDDDHYVQQLVTVIEELDYRQAIPTLRDIFSYVYHYKVLSAAELLAKWQDKASVPFMRRYIDSKYKTATSDTHIHVLKALYKIEGSSCASYVAEILLNSPVSIQRGIYYHTLEEFKNEPVVMEAARRLVETTSDPEIRKNVGAFVERNK